MSVVDNAVASFLDGMGGALPWKNKKHRPAIVVESVVLGEAKGEGFEVAIGKATSRPTKAVLLDVWKERHGGRAAGVLLVLAYGEGGTTRAVLAGPDPDSPVRHLELALVESVVERALEAETLKEARAVIGGLPSHQADGDVVGLRNDGLFSTYTLLESTRNRPDWTEAAANGQAVRGANGVQVLSELGWSQESSADVIILRDEAKHRGVAVLLNADETFDGPSLRFGLGVSPVEHAVLAARKAELDWVIAVQGTRVRLYAADPGEGVARAGVAAFVELDLAMLTGSDLAYAWLLLSPAALDRDGTVRQILADSRDHATALGVRLRDRIYADVVGKLATIVAERLGDKTEGGLQQAYHVTLVVLFRLLFVAYAEDRGLLPYESGPSGPRNAYSQQSLKALAIRYAGAMRAGEKLRFDPASTSTWDDLRQVWHAVYHGNVDWQVPPYGGNLFDDSTDTGHQIDSLKLTNAEFGPLVASLTVDRNEDGVQGPVDFRSLSVREFGTIYEGLLESSLSVAPRDLALDADDTYVPLTSGRELVVPSGEVYFHNSSGARKATGSYFTKSFAVEHLLESALDPAIDEHLQRVSVLLDEDRSADAAFALFDFSVADIAMGSGHFLVGASSHIATKFEAFLSERPIAGVAAELESMRRVARERLESVGLGAKSDELRNSDLILRQVVKRCIYGVDLNVVAVDLARLSLWIHSFVPGLPMSALDHGLIAGNSLTGIASLDELMDILEPSEWVDGRATSLMFDSVLEALGAADEPLARAARLSEVTVDESEEAAALHEEAVGSLEPLRRVMDAALASRLDEIPAISECTMFGWDALVDLGSDARVGLVVERLDPVHFPIAFPEVFRASRARRGFDVILGNPPWDEVMVEEPKFWQRYEGGIMGLKPGPLKKRIAELRIERADLVPLLEAESALAAEIRRTLLKGPFPGLGTGDVDYYQAFAWRMTSLVSAGGRLGAVFPRSLLNAAGTEAWRLRALEDFAFESVTSLVNTGHWVFDIHPQYSTLLLYMRRVADGEIPTTVSLHGPYHSLRDFQAGGTGTGALSVSRLLDWGNGAAFPLLPSAEATSVFEQMRKHPRFDANPIGDFRPVAEFHATNDRKTFDAGDESPDTWPVLTGASFEHWDPDFGEPYAWADPDTVIEALQKKRLRQVRNKRTAFFGLPDSVAADSNTLPCLSPRIVFRDIARATDTRTVISALAPGGVVLTNTSPYLLGVEVDASREAAMLGVLSSRILDWYARRYVELHLNMHILKAFPVPAWSEGSDMWLRLASLSGRLAAVDARFEAWAAEVGVPVGGLQDAEKDDSIAEIDALVAHLYGLSRDQVAIVFSTFHRGWDFQPALDRTLRHYDRWASAREQEAPA